VGNESFQKTILYVDDQPSHRALFLKAFQSQYQIVTAASGEEGLEIIKKNKIALVIADHNMPGMTGIDFLEKVQEMSPSAEKAILSAYLDDGILKDLNRRVVKVSGQLSKPWKLDGMRGYIEKALTSFAQLDAAISPISEEAEVPGVPSLPQSHDQAETPSSEVVTDKPLLTSHELAHGLDHIVSATIDPRGARRILLHFVEPKIRSFFPLIRKPCAPLIKQAQDEALSGDVDALDKTLRRYLQEDGLLRALLQDAEPTKKIIH
jgi:CheY-like chemotaxis protein